MGNPYLKNIAAAAGVPSSVSGNQPVQYGSRNRAYFTQESRAFYQQYAKYADDCFTVRVQGLEPSGRSLWGSYTVRMADLVKKTAAGMRSVDDYKAVLFVSPSVSYIPQGAKLEAMGSTWLCTNPKNISVGSGTGVFRRCNSVWNHLDFYGNVKSEPIIVENVFADASTPDDQDFLLLAKGTYRIRCQYNENTATLRQNSRLILGSGAAAVSSITDFVQEFTGDYDSVGMLEMVVRYEQPNAETDDMVNHVAGGLAFSWHIAISGNLTAKEGQTFQLTAESARYGEAIDEMFVSYAWESSDSTVAQFRSNGVFEAVSAGTATITCRLSENTAIYAQVEVVVEPAESGTAVSFSSAVPNAAAAYETVSLSAAVYENGEETDGIVEWSFSGAEQSAYKAVTNGNNAAVTCYCASKTQLTVTAEYGDKSVSANIILEGL